MTKFGRDKLLLYAVTDRTWLKGRTMEEQVEEALKGGVTCVQLREKKLDKTALIEEAKSIKRLCEEYNVPFIINDDPETALLVGADGVHVGQKDMSPAAARELLGENKIIGVSARTVEQALKAQKEGADYLGVGAVFGTGTKADAQAISLESLRDICRAVKIPVVAIGGINEEHIPRLSGTGIAGVAVVSAIFASDDIKEASRRLRRQALKL